MTMADKIQTLWPELVLTVSAFVVMLTGLSRQEAVRRATYPITLAALITAAVVGIASGASNIPGLDPMATFIKVGVAGVGVILVMIMAELPDEAGGEPVDDAVTGFNPSQTIRGELYGFFLLSLTGAMLCASARDLIWLFLALELTSLPTYVMVAISRRGTRGPEGAVKYFFLGALSACLFLYGFALIYGATGSTTFEGIAAALEQQRAANGGDIDLLSLVGLSLAVIGLCFKIAAFPMHGYVGDVYQGAAAPVTAFLAFVPKTAGFLGLILVVGALGWPMNLVPDATDHGEVFHTLLAGLAILTMLIGNTLALVQSNVKRVLAYSSVAHSGYMMVALVAGAATWTADPSLSNGVGAILFYLIGYGVMNAGAFAALALLRRNGDEAESFADLRGLGRRHPYLGAMLAICVLSLLGFPPLIGFWGKAYIVGAAVDAGQYTLVVWLVINSAIGAFYYLRIVAECYLPEPDDLVERVDRPARSFALGLAAWAVVVLSLVVGPLLAASNRAARDVTGNNTHPVVKQTTVGGETSGLAQQR